MLTSTKNPLVKQLRALGDSAKERREQGLFLVEGTHALTEAIATNYPLSIICCTEKWIANHPALYAQVANGASTIDRLEIVSEEVLQAIATTKNPDGAIAAALLPDTNNAGNAAIKTLGLVLETLQDPANLGAIIRTSVAAEIDGLLISSDSVDLTNPKIIRATAGQWFRCTMQTTGDIAAEVQSLQAQGIKAIATVANAPKSYWDYDFRQPTVILLGNEGNGLSEQLIALADETVSIPQSDRVESLNVAICAALMLYEALRQRRGSKQ